MASGDEAPHPRATLDHENDISMVVASLMQCLQALSSRKVSMDLVSSKESIRQQQEQNQQLHLLTAELRQELRSSQESTSAVVEEREPFAES